MTSLGNAFNSEVKIAAIVAAAYADSEVPARPLDTAFLGKSLVAETDGSYAITPLRFHVGPDLDTDDDGLSSSGGADLGTQPVSGRHGWRRPSRWLGSSPRTESEEPIRLDGAGGGNPDGCAHENLSELRAGTHPKDPNSTLRLKATS